MRIYLNELYKLLTSRVFIAVAVIAAAFCIYSTAFAGDILVSDSEYKAFFEETENSQQTEYIQERIEYYTALADSDPSAFNSVIFLREQLSQAQAVQDYQEYLQGISDSAANMTGVSIFADKDSFTYKNIVATPKAYDKVSDVGPVFSPSEGVLLLVDSSFDIALLFILAAAVAVLVGRERETGITGLLKPLKHGRARLAVSKLTALFTVAVSACLVLFIAIFSIASARFGLGDLSRPIQSVEGFIGCDLPINVWQAIAIIYALKLLTAFAIAAVFYCLCCRLSVAISVIVMAVLSAAEILLYTNIPLSSLLAPLAYINPASFMNGTRLLHTYNNINLFGEPVNLLPLTAVSIILLITMSVTVAVFLFGGMSISPIKKRSFKLRLNIRTPSRSFSYTLYKLFVMHKGALILLIVAALQLYNCITYQAVYDPDDSYYKMYCETIAGLDTQGAQEYISAEEQRFESLYEKLLSPDTQQAEFIQISRELNAKTGFENAKEQYEYIQSLADGDREMFYQTGWRILFGVNGYRTDMLLALLAAGALCIMLLPLIAYDNKCRIGYIVFAAKSGKRTYYRRCFAAAAIAAVMTGSVVYLPHTISVVSAYGNSGIHASIRCIEAYGEYANVSILGYVFILFALRIAVLILFSFILVWLSSVSKSPATALLTGVTLFLLPMLLYIAGYDKLLSLCIPLSINHQWLGRGAAIFINLAAFVAAGVAVTIHKCCEKDAG